MRGTCRAALAGVVLVAAGSATPALAAAPVKAKLPPVVVAGQHVTVTAVAAKAPKAAKRLRVRILLSPTKLTAAGTVVGVASTGKVRKRKARKVRVATVIPAQTPLTAAYVIGCVQRDRHPERCAVLGRLAISATAAASAKIEAARVAGIISASKALHYLAASVSGGAVPAAYRNGRGIVDDGGSRLIALWSVVGGADRAFLLPYLLPPDTVGSAWALGHKKKKRAPAAPALRIAQAADPCAAHKEFDAIGWQTVSAAGGKVLFHFDATTPETTRTVMTSAMNTYIYGPLTTGNGFREPVPDGTETCAHGGTAAVDVYVSSEMTAGGGGLTVTFPPTASNPCFAKPHPVFILANPSIGPVGLAHEFFHAVQAAYGYVKFCPTGDFSWFDEGTAVWAEYLAYPGNSFTRVGRGLHPIRTVAGMLNAYSSWVFWYAMTRNHGGPSVVAAALAGLESSHARTKPAAVHAFDKAIPGGLRKGLEEYAAYAWNQDPIGSGFPFTTDYATWNIDPEPPWLPLQPLPLELGGLHVKTVKLDAGNLVSGKLYGLTFGQRRYTNLTVPDGNVKELRWKNAFFGKPGLDVQAYLHLADGTWRAEDWSNRPTVTLCRTRATENVDRILITTTNADIAGLRYLADGNADEMRLRDLCLFPTTYTGTWTRVITDPTRGSWTETIHGSATFVREPLPPIADEIIQVTYDLKTASVTWTMSGGLPPGTCTTTFGGTGTETTLLSHDPLGDTKLALEDVSTRPGIPPGEPQPFYYAVEATGGPVNAPLYDINVTGPPGCNSSQEPIIVFFLGIGVFGDFTSLTPDVIPNIEKSATTAVLQGSRLHTDGFLAPYVINDSWHFVALD